VEPLRAALEIAERIGAAPIVAAVTDIARRAGIDLATTARTPEPASRVDRRLIEQLTPRERDVLALVAAGHSNPEIAERLFITPKTASVHLTNIKGKLGVRSRIEAATVAVRLGLVAEPADEEI
jgi:DNA-binding NarL/FixJ family response regulator